MNKHALEVIGAILILVGIMIAFAFLLRGGKEETETPTETPTDTQVEVEASFPREVLNQDPLILPDPTARVFVERFGSFSSESGYRNIDDILPLASPTLKTRLLATLDEIRRTTSGYYGISTRVLSLKLNEEIDGRATMTVNTQRVETIDSPANTSIRYQEIDLELIKNGDQWLVDNYVWR